MADQLGFSSPFFGGSSGDSQQSIIDFWNNHYSEESRRYDLGRQDTAAARQQSAKQAKAELDYRYAALKQQARTAQESLELDTWYRHAQQDLAEKQFAETQRQFDKTFGLNEAGLTGTYNGAPTLQGKQFGLNEAGVTGYYNGAPTLGREQFGLDIARTAAEMQARPDMAYQFGAFKQSLPAYLRGAVPTGATVTAGGGPQPQTLQGMMQSMGVASYLNPSVSAQQTTTAVDPTLAAIGATNQAGFDKMGAQQLESMDPNDLAFLKSGTNYLGYDFDRGVRSYNRSRLGQ